MIGNSANFFSYVSNVKKIKELFVFTLNGITATVRCVSSMIVVLNAKLSRLIATHANKRYGEKRTSPKRVPCLLVETQTFNFYRSLDCAREDESIIYFLTIYAS